MPDFVFPPPPPVALPVRGSDLFFPAGRVYCVGRNYAGHVREMGDEPGRAPPFFFRKSREDLNLSGKIARPGYSGELHHEIELVACLGKGGHRLSDSEALACVFGYAVGLDMTCRDVQTAARKAGQPWEMAKGFPGSAPVGPVVPVADLPAGGIPGKGRITLSVNGVIRQDGDISSMIWHVPELIARLSRFLVLAPGDLVFTGTPAGVGPVEPGDRLSGEIGGLGQIGLLVVETG